MQQYYQVFENGKSSAKASQKLQGIMRNTDESNKTAAQQAQTPLQEVNEDDKEIQEALKTRMGTLERRFHKYYPNIVCRRHYCIKHHVYLHEGKN